MKDVFIRRPLRTGLRLALAAGAMALSAAAGESAPVPPEMEVFVRTHGSLGESRVASTRSRGMGGAYAALVDGAGSVQENPAALGAFCGKSVGGGLAFESVEDANDTTKITTINIGGAFSLNPYLDADAPNQSVGVAYKTSSYDNLGGASRSGKFDDSGITFAYGRTFGPNILAGASVSIVNDEYAWKAWKTMPYEAREYEVTGGEFLLGGLYRASDVVTIGGVASYATGRARERVRYQQEDDFALETGDFRRWRLRGGASWQAAEQTLVTGDLEYAATQMEFDPGGSADVRRSKSKSAAIMAGVEQELLPESLVLRGGIYGKQEKFSAGDASYDKLSYWGFNAGVGARVKSVDLNYTLDVRTTGDIGHFFGMQYDW